FLPGPASSQVGIAVGILRAGIPGAFCAWLGFTTPSALALILFAYGVAHFGDLGHAAWLHGLKIVAVAVVAQAVWSMARPLCPDRERATTAAVAAIAALMIPGTIGQVAIIVAGGLIGWQLLAPVAAEAETRASVPISRTVSIVALTSFAVLLVGLPL